MSEFENNNVFPNGNPNEYNEVTPNEAPTPVEPSQPTVEPTVQQPTQQTTQQNAQSTSNYGYQNSYYRNTNPYQDQPVYSNPTQPTQNAQEPQSNNGSTPPPKAPEYSYANYYSNPVPNGNGPKKKHTGLKIVAGILAVVVVATGSIGVWEGIHSLMDKNDSDTSTTMSDDAVAEIQGGQNEKDETEQKEDSSSDSKKDEGKSWIEMSAEGDALSVADIVEKVNPSVVGVEATFTGTTSASNSYDYFNFFGYGNNGQQQQTTQATSVGTGIIMSEEGYIITNAHVIYDDEYGYGEATSVNIIMYDEETNYEAKLVAYDTEADLAVLKIDAEGLVAAEFGDSDDLRVGDMVVAIGNPLGLEFQNTTTCGIVSALNRQVTINDKTMTLIQTDTAINSGNSGGPLINSYGQVIGINSAKMSSSYSSDSASVEGMAFAIPMSEAQSIIDDLINYGYVTGRPKLGITCQDVSEAVSQAYNIPVGAYVVSVTDNGAAALAGIQVGDVIVAIEGTTISTTEELNDIKNIYNAGDTVTLTIVRSGQQMDVQVTLQEVTDAD